MPNKAKQSEDDAILAELKAIRTTLQDLFIIQARAAGIKKSSVRSILGVGDGQVTRVWKELGGE